MNEHDPEAIARARLRERQGAGARYDAPAAPAGDLVLARRGTAYFSRQLNGLTDHELDGPGSGGWPSRRHVIVDIAFQARWMARIVSAARLGLDVETIAEPELFLEDVELALTLPAHALRYLFQHSHVHLNVEWRDLADESWARTITARDGRTAVIAETPRMRARTIWNGALGLNHRARRDDVPAGLLQD